MSTLQKISPCLWFDTAAEEAANLYISIFPNSRIDSILRYSEAGQEVHGKAPGSVLVVSFVLDEQSFSALNGGPQFSFSEAISMMITCESQEEIDHYWDKLGAGGDPSAQQCGWLKDRFGLSWQVAPRRIFEMLQDKDAAKAGRAMEAMMQMRKMDLAELERAFMG